MLTDTRSTDCLGADAAGLPALVPGAGGAESSDQGATASGTHVATAAAAPKHTTNLLPQTQVAAGAGAPQQATRHAQAAAGATFSLLDFAPKSKTSRRSKAGRQQAVQENGEALNASGAWQTGLNQGLHVSPAARALEEPHSPPPASLSLAAIQAEQGGGKQGRRRGKVNRPMTGDHAWRNEQNVAPAASVDEIQRRELWEAEEREALDLIRAVYGDAAFSPPG